MPSFYALLVLLLFTGFSTQSMAKPLLQVKVSVQVSNGTLEDCIKTIEKQTGMGFLYNGEELSKIECPSVEWKDESIDEILDQVLLNTGFYYKIKDEVILIKKSAKEAEPIQQKQEKKEVRGKVVDSNGVSLPGVTVMEKGTTNGVITNIDGEYTIEVMGNPLLSFSFVGMKTFEISADKETINVTLQEDAIGLDEVVAIGYGNAKKSDLTGSVTSVKTEQFESRPISKVDQALQGNVAGVNVTQTSGDPSSGYKIRIRGVNSLNFSNSPLYVVDGMVVSDINTLNFNDVSSIDVLKDASATAIYGSRGANGVIIISTKNGKKGGFTVDFDSFLSVQRAAKELDMLSAYDYAQEVNDRNVILGSNPIYSTEELKHLQENGGTDWQNKALKDNTLVKSYQLSISGGTKKTDYYMSVNYTDNEGIIYSKDYERYSTRLKLNSELNKNFKMGMNVSLNREEINGELVDMSNLLTFDPTTSLYDENGNYNLFSTKGVGTIKQNSYIDALETDRKGVNEKIYTNAYIEAKFGNGFTFRTSGGAEFGNSQNKMYQSSIIIPNGSIKWTDTKYRRLVNTNLLSYEKKLDQHKLKFDAVQEFTYYKFEGNIIAASDLVNESLGYEGLASAESLTSTPSSTSNKMESYMLRANYQYANKYMLTLTGRYDGSSNFSDGNQWGFFPSVGGSWILSEEDFIKNLDLVDFMKFRISYGATGNQNVGDVNNRFLNLASNSAAGNGGWPAHNYTYPVSNGEAILGMIPTNSQISPNSTWEKNKQIDLGLEVSFLDGRLSASIDAYKKVSTDLLLEKVLPSYAGIVKITDNIGELENKGLDISASYRLSDQNELKWKINGNISFNRNKVLDLGDTFDSETGAKVPVEEIRIGGLHYNGIGGGAVSAIVRNKSIGQFLGVKFDGIYQLGEEAEAAKYGLQAGDPKYIDENEDGVINSDDRVYLGSAMPKFTWGITNEFNYKNFTLSFLIQGKVGGKIYNLNRAVLLGHTLQNPNATIAETKKRWSPTNPTNALPGYTDSADAIQLLSSMYVEKATFTRLKNVSLSYNFPQAVLDKLHLNSMKLYVSGTNLLTISDFEGYDPEVTSATDDHADIDSGIVANDFVPIPKSYTVGVKLSF